MMPLHDTQQMGDTVLTLAKGLGHKSAAPVEAPPVEAVPAAEAAAPAAGTAAPEGDAAAAAMPAPAAPVAPAILGLDAENFLAYLKSWWKAQVWFPLGMPGSFDDFWVTCLQRGGSFETIAPTGATLNLSAPLAISAPAMSGSGDMTLVVFPHPFIYDGRHANKPWAQEVPEPLSSFTWGTWAEVHPKTAAKLGLTKDDKVTVTTEAGNLTVGWFGSPGIREDVVAVVLGNGQEKAGRYVRVATQAGGANANRLLLNKADDGGAQVFVQAKASVAKATGPNLHPYLGHIDTDGRGINFTVSVNDLGKGDGPASIVPQHHVPIDPRVVKAGLTDMYPEPEHPTYRFAMAVDLNRCTGCGVRDGLLRREQPLGRRSRAAPPGPSHGLAAALPLLGGRRRAARRPLPARDLPAVQPRALRGCVPGPRDLPQPRWSQRDGLQPLRGHALLRQQLPLHRAALQLPQLQVARELPPHA